jgi:hypothetical protein
MSDAKLANGAIKIGPLWNRAVFDPASRLVTRRGRKVCSFEEVKWLLLREYIARDEEEQLLNAHPEVQKRPRDAELWVETKDGVRRCVATLDRAGLLLQLANQAAVLIGVPVQTERTLIAPSEPGIT